MRAKWKLHNRARYKRRALFRATKFRNEPHRRPEVMVQMRSFTRNDSAARADARPMDDDDDWWREPGEIRGHGGGLTAEEIVEHERVPRIESLGLLDSHGDPLVRYVMPIKASHIGFEMGGGGPEETACITTEAYLRMLDTVAGESGDGDGPESDDDECP